MRNFLQFGPFSFTKLSKMTITIRFNGVLALNHCLSKMNLLHGAENQNGQRHFNIKSQSNSTAKKVGRHGLMILTFPCLTLLLQHSGLPHVVTAEGLVTSSTKIKIA